MVERVYDFVTNIDRYEGSETFGEEVLLFICLWNKVGGMISDGGVALSGALAPDTRVDIIDKVTHDSVDWYKVSATQSGKLQIGWCAVTLLRNAGAEYFEDLKNDN